MNYLLDTCFISELRKPKPKQSVLDWFDGVDKRGLYVSALTIGELRYGIALLPDNTKKKDLEAWLRSIEDSFAALVILVDAEVAKKWGDMRASAQTRGHNISVVDGLPAATCSTYKLILVTRNEKGFSATGIEILNPWGYFWHLFSIDSIIKYEKKNSRGIKMSVTSMKNLKLLK